MRAFSAQGQEKPAAATLLPGLELAGQESQGQVSGAQQAMMWWLLVSELLGQLHLAKRNL